MVYLCGMLSLSVPTSWELRLISSFLLNHGDSWHLVLHADPPVSSWLATLSGSAVQWPRQQRHDDGKVERCTHTHEQSVAKGEKSEEGQPHNYLIKPLHAAPFISPRQRVGRGSDNDAL